MVMNCVIFLDRVGLMFILKRDYMGLIFVVNRNIK